MNMENKTDLDISVKKELDDNSDLDTSVKNKSIDNSDLDTSVKKESVDNSDIDISVKKESVDNSDLDIALKKEQAGYFRIFGRSSLLYAIVYTICMFQNSSGITMPVWIAAAIVYACVSMKKMSAGADGKQFTPRKSWFYITIMLLLGIATFSTDNSYMICLNYIGFFVMLILFLLHNFYDDSQWDFSKSLTETAAAVFGAIGCIFTPLTDGYAFCQEKEHRNNQTFRAVLAGLLLAVPGLLFLGFCLMCADAVFDTMVTKLFSGLSVPVKVMEVTGMLMFGYFSSYCGMRYLTCRRQTEVQTRKNKTAFDPIIAMTFAGLLLVMYLVFCGIQVIYLFADNMQLPEGITYAEYAHQGFYMLLFVCLINLVLVLFIRKYFAEHKILDSMLLMICGCTFVMIASSSYRMFLYIRVYQLTFLRVFVLVMLGALALLMAGVVLMILKPQFPLFRYSLAVVSVIYLCLAFSHADGFIASYNLSHAGETEYMDWSYLSGLSLDAAPAVADFYAGASAEIQQKLELAAWQEKKAEGPDGYRTGYESYDEEDYSEETYWFGYYMGTVYRAEHNMGLRSFNLSRYRAVKLFKNFLGSVK